MSYADSKACGGARVSVCVRCCSFVVSSLSGGPDCMYAQATERVSITASDITCCRCLILLTGTCVFGSRVSSTGLDVSETRMFYSKTRPSSLVGSLCTRVCGVQNGMYTHRKLASSSIMYFRGTFSCHLGNDGESVLRSVSVGLTSTFIHANRCSGNTV